MNRSAAMSVLMRFCVAWPAGEPAVVMLAVDTGVAAAGRMDPAGATNDVMSAAAAIRMARLLPVLLTSSSWYLGLTPSRCGRAAVGGAGSPVPRGGANLHQCHVCPPVQATKYSCRHPADSA